MGWSRMPPMPHPRPPDNTDVSHHGGPDLSTTRRKPAVQVPGAAADTSGVTRPLYHALAARLAVVAVATLTLGGIGIHAAVTRPAPVVWHWTYETP